MADEKRQRGASALGDSYDDETHQAEALRKMTKLVNSLLSRADCGPFREPVDWRGLELYDYPKIIKKMMDLGTVKRKLDRNQYKNAAQCADDIRLIWSNCKTYNADGSDFYLLAESFSKKFEDRYKKIRAEFNLDAPPSSKRSSGGPSSGSATGDRHDQPPSLEAKARFGTDLFRLSGSELGHVMQILDLRCPAALEVPTKTKETKKSMYDFDRGVAVEINLDVVDGRTFYDLERYVRDRVSGRVRGGSGGGGGASGRNGFGGNGGGDEETFEEDTKYVDSGTSRVGGGKKRKK